MGIINGFRQISFSRLFSGKYNPDRYHHEQSIATMNWISHSQLLDRKVDWYFIFFTLVLDAAPSFHLNLMKIKQN